MQRLWILLSLVMELSFAMLGWIGARIDQLVPPIADKVLTTSGQVVVDEGELQAGQNAWQSLGGMDVGSIWGHGSYVAPDRKSWLAARRTLRSRPVL